jgi:hypothetical protein
LWDPNIDGITHDDFMKYLRGLDGNNGADGNDGDSAYEVWKKGMVSGVSSFPYWHSTSTWNGNPALLTEAAFFTWLTGIAGDDGLMLEIVTGMFNAFQAWSHDCDAQSYRTWSTTDPGHLDPSIWSTYTPSTSYPKGQAGNFNIFLQYVVKEGASGAWYLAQ